MRDIGDASEVDNVLLALSGVLGVPLGKRADELIKRLAGTYGVILDDGEISYAFGGIAKCADRYNGVYGEKAAVESINAEEIKKAAEYFVDIVKIISKNNGGSEITIAMETDWIAELGTAQNSAIGGLMNELKVRVNNYLKAAGIENVKIISGRASELPGMIRDAARGNYSNLVIFGGKNTVVESGDFKEFMTTEDKRGAFISGVDPSELAVKGMTRDVEENYVRIVEMLTLTLELAFKVGSGIEDKLDIVRKKYDFLKISYDSVTRVLLMIPKAEPVKIHDLKNLYDSAARAIKSL
jgi:hypothetical protein